MDAEIKGGRIKPQAAAVGLIALLLIFIAGGAGYLFWKSYSDAQTALRSRAASASQVVSTNVVWAMETARQILRRVDDSLGPDLSVTSADAEPRIAEAIANLPGSVKVYVVDANGVTRLKTDPQFKPLDVRDREYFSAVAAGDAWHVTPLLVSRLNGEQIFAISKRIERNGKFAGAAILSISSDFMKEIWQSLDFDAQSTVGLFRNDGQLVSRYPLPAGPMDLSKYVLFTEYLPKQPTGTYDAVSPADGVSRLVAYRRVPGTDLIALSSVSKTAGLASFNQNAVRILTFAVPAIIGLLALAYWAFGLLRRDARQREIEAEFRIVAEAMANHVWTARPDGNLDWFNSRVYEYTGAQAGSLDGQAWSKVVHPDDLAAAAARWSGALSMGHIYETEFRLMRADGVYRWHIARAVPIRNAAGQIVRWIGTNTDIDEQKRIAEALAASEARLRLAIKAGQLAVWETDGKNIRSSSALNRLYGFPPEARPSLKEYVARYAPGELERVTRLASEAASRGDTDFEAEVRHLWPDGTEKWLLVRAQSKEPKGGFEGRAIGVVIDITERKRVEQALADSERRIRLSQKAAGIASLELDIASGTVYGSERFWEIWGLSPRDSVHISVLENIVVPEDRLIRSNEHTRKTGTAETSVEYRIRRPDTGEIRWLSRHIEFEHDAAGKPVTMFGVMQDITAQKEAQDRQQMLTHELEHRIKNILAMVSAISSQTLRTGDLGSARQALLERLQALGNAHDLLTKTRWTQASMAEVIQAAAAPLPPGRVSLEGPQILLKPKMALSMALAINELGTNALKYGALSTDLGRVSIDWSITRGEGMEPALVWRWRETGGPPVTPPTRRGFGSLLISRVLAADFDAAVEADYRPEGLTVTMTVPLSRLQ